jgi:hypothetical protein
MLTKKTKRKRDMMARIFMREKRKFNTELRQKGFKGWVSERVDADDPESLIYSDKKFWYEIENGLLCKDKETIERTIEEEVEQEILSEIEKEIERENVVSEEEIENEQNIVSRNEHLGENKVKRRWN